MTLQRADAPMLVVELGLEDGPRISIRAGSHEDERRIRLWLRRTGAIAALGFALEQALNDLDEGERRRPAA